MKSQNNNPNLGIGREFKVITTIICEESPLSILWIVQFLIQVNDLGANPGEEANPSRKSSAPYKSYQRA